MKDYKSTAEAARELGLSIGTVQKLVSIGELEALRTQGGHRRIFTTSLDKYKTKHGYRSASSPIKTENFICIIHKDSDLDPLLIEGHDPQVVRLMSNPLDLLGMEDKIHSLFIDANNEWVKNMPKTMIDDLHSKYSIIVYNSEKLPENSYFHQTENAFLIPTTISSNFISGYLVGEKAFKKNNLPV